MRRTANSNEISPRIKRFWSAFKDSSLYILQKMRWQPGHQHPTNPNDSQRSDTYKRSQAHEPMPSILENVLLFGGHPRSTTIMSKEIFLEQPEKEGGPGGYSTRWGNTLLATPHISSLGVFVRSLSLPMEPLMTQCRKFRRPDAVREPRGAVSSSRPRI